MEHEQSLRNLEKRRSDKLKARLEKQLELASEEAAETKLLLEEVREQNEAHIKTLRDGRQDALRQLNETQQRLNELIIQQEDEDFGDRADDERVIHLEAQLQARTDEADALRERLEEVVAEYKQDLNKITTEAKAEVNSEKIPKETSSPAPKAVMKELNRTRIELSDSERKYRQLQRKAEQWRTKAENYIQQKEAAASAKLRVSKLELEVKTLRQQAEHESAVNTQWQEFTKEIGLVFNLIDTSSEGPPEISTVMRHMKKQLRHIKSIEEEKERIEYQMKQISERNEQLEKEVRDTNTMLSRVKRDAELIQCKLDEKNQQLQSVKAQEGIWHREVEGLQKLLKTFDDMLPVQPSPGDATIKSLNLTIAMKKEEIDVLKLEQDRLRSEAESNASDLEKLQMEHDRVLDKFTKLRDALMNERSKAENAEERAQYAETLAGKGQFNEDHSRVLHMERNPLFDAMRERFQKEISTLKKRLEDLTGESASSNMNQSQILSEVDPEKLHKRLKDTFKEQIGLFREGVYLITGFKIDMLLDKSNPYFKVRSVYGEKEEDFLIFNWPKGVKQPKSLDLRATDFAKILSTTDAYQYLTKYDSMPGFMASTQLSLLEKCTFV